MSYFKSIVFFFSLFFSLTISAQKFYRFKADVSVKDKLANNTYRLTMGKVYYDKIYKKIVYDLNFPEKETLVIQDTTMFKINEKGLLVSSNKTLLMPEFTVFHLALTGKLFDYGINAMQSEKSIYKVGKVEKTSQGVKTTWVPADDYYAKYFGNIVMLNKDKKLDAMVFYGVDGRMVSRQFFKKYTSVKGIQFPQEVTMISYAEDGTKNIQLSTYKNVVIDQPDENEKYRYRIPITQSARAIK
jgi:hypothetical protein